MPLSRLLLLLPLALLSIGLVSCDSSDDDPVTVHDTVVVTRQQTGTVYGRIFLRDSTGLLEQNAGGVTVTITGTPLTTMTGSEGEWMLDSVPSGTYVIKFSRIGYQDAYIVDQRISGGGVNFVNPGYVYGLPTFSIADLQVQLTRQGDMVTINVQGATDRPRPVDAGRNSSSPIPVYIHVQADSTIAGYVTPPPYDYRNHSRTISAGGDDPMRFAGSSSFLTYAELEKLADSNRMIYFIAMSSYYSPAVYDSATGLVVAGRMSPQYTRIAAVRLP